jgi:hypothetical protein
MLSVSPSRRVQHLVVCVIASGLLALGVGAAALAAGCGSPSSSPSSPSSSQKLLRGLWDDTFVTADAAKQNEILTEIASPDQLHADVVRLMVFWASAEPQEGTFDDAYLAPIKQAITAARAHGLKVILTTYATPEWVQDKGFWKQPPGGFKADTYLNFYAPRAAAIPAYGGFARHIAQYFKGQVFAYECWNEPNLMWFLYPQQVPGDKYYGVRTYLALLKQFYAGVKATDPQALVLGGNSASSGDDSVQKTSPLTWALWLKKNGVLNYCDAYAHHPYNVGTSAKQAPGTPPLLRQHTVTLGNIQYLLRIFPHTDFYLTEYGYNSKYSRLFGAGSGVGEVKEADYLRSAFRLAARYPQIKLLMWYLRVDVEGNKADVFSPSMSTGLRRPDLSLKPAWWAYSGGNKVSEDAPGTAALGSTFSVTGRVTHAGQPVPGIRLTLQIQVGNGVTRETGHVTTDAQGGYNFAFAVKNSTLYRVVWPGVAQGELRSVTLQ